LYGVTYLALAPESELVPLLTTPDQEKAVNEYVEKAKNRSERDRMSDVKTVSGIFTGTCAVHPFTNEKIPIWIADYVLAGYGTGAVMAVPAHDTRDYAFAKHFNLPIIQVIEGGHIEEEAYEGKEGIIINSDFRNGKPVKEATQICIARLEEKGIGTGKTTYRIRDAVFSRQRYWGEPVPVYFKNDIPHLVPDEDLPVILPAIDQYLPTENGDPPLGRAKDWKYKGGYPYELNTMPGWAGSSWYFYRYMDPTNNEAFASKDALNYWQDVDLYIG